LAHFNYYSFIFYAKNITAKIVDMKRPKTTGIKLFRTSSNKGTLATPATATNDVHITKVPPPTQISSICPIAANEVGSTTIVEPSGPANAPVNGKPENPEPSKPVIIPTSKIPKAAKTP